MKKIKIILKGIAPLLMNKFNYEETTRKKKIYEPKEEAEKKVYKTSKGKYYVPTKMIKAAMIKAATDFKMGARKTYKEYIKSGIFFDSNEAIIEPNFYIIHEEPVNIQGAMVLSWRPKFENWSISFILNLVDDMIDKTTLKEILIAAGRYKGIGSYRPEYGRFIIEEFNEMQ